MRGLQCTTIAWAGALFAATQVAVALDPAQQLSCTQTYQDEDALKDLAIGESIWIRCPAAGSACESGDFDSNSVSGCGWYADTSSVCGAAVHALGEGYMSLGRRVKVTAIAAQPPQACEANGFESGPVAAPAGVFRIEPEGSENDSVQGPI